MGSVLASLFTYYRYPPKFLGTCCPLWGWSSRLDCPTITDFYRFPLILLDPLPKAWLPPLATGILSLCFLGSLFLHSWSAFRLQQLLCPLKLGPVFYAFQFAVCGEKSSPPRFVGHLTLLLLAELTFAMSTHNLAQSIQLCT